jgi:hypothetical protein
VVSLDALPKGRKHPAILLLLLLPLLLQIPAAAGLSSAFQSHSASAQQEQLRMHLTLPASAHASQQGCGYTQNLLIPARCCRGGYPYSHLLLLGLDGTQSSLLLLLLGQHGAAWCLHVVAY